MIPRIGEAVRARTRYTLRPGVYAILLTGRSVLMTHQARPSPEFQLPGGGVDPGEHLLPALHREVMEETGWRVGNCRRLGAYRRFTYMPEYDLWAEKLCTIFLGRAVRRIAEPSEADHTAHLLPLDAARALVGPAGDAHFLTLVSRRLGHRV